MQLLDPVHLYHQNLVEYQIVLKNLVIDVPPAEPVNVLTSYVFGVDFVGFSAVLST